MSAVLELERWEIKNTIIEMRLMVVGVTEMAYRPCNMHISMYSSLKLSCVKIWVFGNCLPMTWCFVCHSVVVLHHHVVVIK